MKKYMEYRLALYIGLLGISTLSSCINTGQSYMDQPGDPTSCILTKEEGNDATRSTNFCLTKEMVDDIEEHNFSIESIQYWFDKDINIEARDDKGCTILMHVVNEDNAKEADRLGKSSHPGSRVTFEYLLQKADVNAQSNDGDTASMIAARRMNYWAITRLLESDANPLIKNNEGDNVMTLLIKSNYLNYAVSDLKIMIKKIFDNIEKYIEKHGMPSEAVWNDFISSIPKAIGEVHQENTTCDNNKEEDTKTAYQEALNNFLKRLGKA